MLAQLPLNRAGFLSNSGDKFPESDLKLQPVENARWTAFPAGIANLLQSKVSYG
jgi:hypothetical protein